MGKDVNAAIATIKTKRSIQFVDWCPTPPLLLKHGLVWIISLILCTPSVLSSTGMLEKVWKKENSLKPVRTWLLLRRITKKLVWIPSKAKMKEKNTKPTNQESPTKDDFKILN